MSCSAFVKGSNKNKGGVGLFQTSKKGRLFHLLRQRSALWGNPTMRSPSCTLQKRLSVPLLFGQEGNISGHSTERRTY